MDPSIEQKSQRAENNKDELQLAWAKRVLHEALWGQKHFWVVAVICIAVETVLTGIIILAVRYTEIDFVTYMQQAQLFLKGERTYANISGDTGPCVYPALHLYLSAFLSFVTRRGSDIRLGQLVFYCLYIACQATVMATYKAAQIPPIILPLLILSKRLHSIYILRLFNDCWAVTLFYLAVWTMCNGRWRWASMFYSLALGVKMNILLYAPAMVAIYLRALGLQRSIVEALRVVLIQILLAFPFLRQDAASYLGSAFDLSREFMYKWTVNLRFLSENTFLDKRIARGLLLAHGASCILWLHFRWTGIARAGLIPWLHRTAKAPRRRGMKSIGTPSSRFIVTSLFTSNLIGITFSRSLHYQFYSWYAQQLPLLVYLSALPRALKIAIPLCIESAWNTFPSTPWSSMLLLASHLILLCGLWSAKEDDSTADENSQADGQVKGSLLNDFYTSEQSRKSQ